MWRAVIRSLHLKMEITETDLCFSSGNVCFEILKKENKLKKGNTHTYSKTEDALFHKFFQRQQFLSTPEFSWDKNYAIWATCAVILCFTVCFCADISQSSKCIYFNVLMYLKASYCIRKPSGFCLKYRAQESALHDILLRQSPI